MQYQKELDEFLLCIVYQHIAYATLKLLTLIIIKEKTEKNGSEIVSALTSSSEEDSEESQTLNEIKLAYFSHYRIME